MSAEGVRPVAAKRIDRAIPLSLVAFLALAGCWPDTNTPDTSSVKFEGEEIVAGDLIISRPVGFEVVSTWENGIALLESDRRYSLTIHVSLLKDVAKDGAQPRTRVKQIAEAAGSGGPEYSFSSGKLIGSCAIHVGGRRQSDGSPSFIVAHAVLEKARATETAGC